MRVGIGWSGNGTWFIDDEQGEKLHMNLSEIQLLAPAVFLTTPLAGRCWVENCAIQIEDGIATLRRNECTS